MDDPRTNTLGTSRRAPHLSSKGIPTDPMKSPFHRVSVVTAAVALLPGAALGQSSPTVVPQTAVPQTAVPQPTNLPPLTLAQAIEMALQLQPTIASATAQREAAEQRVKQQQARYMPTVSPSYTYFNQYTFGTVPVNNGGVIVNLPSGRTTNNRTEALAGSLRLYDSGARDLAARQARQSFRSTDYAEENTRQTVIGNVADNYFSTLRNDALVKVSAAQVERARTTRDLIKAQVEAGVVAQKDTYQAEADLLNAQVALLQAQNNAEIARTQLKNAIGLVTPQRLAVADFPTPSPAQPTTAQVEGVTPTAPDDDAVRRLIDAAFAVRPDLAQAAANVEVSQTSVDIARLATQPQITADVGTAYQFDANNDPLTNIGRNRQLNLSVTYPLFDGGSTRAGLRASQASKRSVEAQVLTQKQQIALEVEQAWRNLQQARATLPAVEAARQAAQINFDAAVASRREGIGNTVDVITAQTALTQAEINYVQAVYNFWTADARLARAVGQADRVATLGAAPGR